MSLELILFSSRLRQLINTNLLNTNIFIQQNVKIPTSDIHYSIGLVVVCLLVLILLWLPDLLKGER